MKVVDLDENKRGESVSCSITVLLLCFLVDVNEEEKLAVVEEVEQHLARVADDGVRAEVMDVKERELPDDDE